MSRVVNLRMIGRAGNNLFQYAFARAYCEKYDCELRVEPWFGERIFQLNDRYIEKSFPDYHSELDYVPGKANCELRGYFQCQKAMIYTRSNIRKWFAWRPEIIEKLGHFNDTALAHLRRGDYFGYGYPVVSGLSYVNCCRHFGIPLEDVRHISEENPTEVPGFEQLPFVPDFWRMAHSPILLRANSSFSWWAATLAENQRTFSPVVDGCEGGREHDVHFVEGNYPRLCNLEFVTDLHLEE